MKENSYKTLKLTFLFSELLQSQEILCISVILIYKLIHTGASNELTILLLQAMCKYGRCSFYFEELAS